MKRVGLSAALPLGLIAAALLGSGPPSGQTLGSAVSLPAVGDEFVGPFPSWSDAQSMYGARGDGKADDSAALQKGLDDLASGRSSVFYIPPGSYRLTRTLILSDVQNVSVIGAHPDTTRLVWDGEPGGSMLLINGVAYSRFNRLTFDGAGRAGTGVEQSWDGEGGHFDTGNEYADDRFVNLDYGIRGGFLDFGFAETSILRSAFIRNRVAGVAHGNFNALDTWIWYSLFEDCGAGVTNDPGAGNFHVYNSVFRRSRRADIAIHNTGTFSARGNYSENSRMFFEAPVNTNHPAVIHLQRNVVVDPLENTAIRLGNQGPGLLTDNIVRNRPGTVGPVVQWDNSFGPDVVSIGNTFTVREPVRTNGRLLTLDDRVVDAAEIDVPAPVLPGPWPALNRRVFEVPPGADAGVIQRMIDAAAASAGSRPVVHLPSGEYSLQETLTVPAGDIQIVGDGYVTVLRWAGEGEGPVLRLDGPSAATIRDLRVVGTGGADGIVARGVDQAGARVYLHQTQLRSARRADLWVNGLDHAYVHIEDIGHAYSPEGVAIRVSGGPQLSAGRPAEGRVSVYSGASAGNRISYEVSDGARMLVRDLWYESGGGPGFVRVQGRAEFTADGVRVASPVNQDAPAFDIVDHDGRVTVVASHIDDRIRVAGEARRSSVLVLSNFCEQAFSRCFVNRAASGGTAVALNSREISGSRPTRSVSAADIGKADPAFLRRMLGHARGEVPSVVRALPSGVTDLRFYRVWVSDSAHNLRLEAR